MIEHFIQSFWNFSIGQTVIVISAIVFLVKVYKKVTTYISKKALDEKEKNDQIQKLIDQAKQYPVWHQQSIDIRENLNELISNLDKKMDKLDLICEALDCELDELIVRIPNRESNITHTRRGNQKAQNKCRCNGISE